MSTSPAVTNVTFHGTLVGTVDGRELMLAYAAPPGSVEGFPDCSASGNGTVAVTGSVMSGNLDVVFGSCNGPRLQPPASSQVTLTRQ